MSELKDLFNKRFRVILFVVAFVAVVYLIAQNINTFGNILLTMLGFGSVVLVHEFGHFIVAKLSDIKVEAFSILCRRLCSVCKKQKKVFAFGYCQRYSPKKVMSPVMVG